MATLCWYNKRWFAADEPVITGTDRSYLYGDGVFETLRSRKGRFFRLERHLHRLHRGMEVLGIESGDGVADALESLNDIFPLLETLDVVVRLTVSRGNGWLENAQDVPGVVTMLAKPAPESLPEAGRAVLSSIIRDATSPVADIKTCNWLPNILARREAEGLGYDEAILLNGSGFITEASSSNVFWVKAGILYTPAVETGALPGITREAVIEAAQHCGIPVREGNFLPEALRESEAAFLTNSVHQMRSLASFGKSVLLKDDPKGCVTAIQTQLDALIDFEAQATRA